MSLVPVCTAVITQPIVSLLFHVFSDLSKQFRHAKKILYRLVNSPVSWDFYPTKDGVERFRNVFLDTGWEAHVSNWIWCKIIT